MSKTYLAFENFEAKKEAYLIVSEVFNTISKDMKIEGIGSYNQKTFLLVEETSKKIGKSVVDRIIKSHQAIMAKHLGVFPQELPTNY